MFERTATSLWTERLRTSDQILASISHRTAGVVKKKLPLREDACNEEMDEAVVVVAAALFQLFLPRLVESCTRCRRLAILASNRILSLTFQFWLICLKTAAIFVWLLYVFLPCT
ncbi:unnamed protein product [Mesocestoides corti]|uniref:Uncharacterized protein n=1 Tax=Mesocestoides corti TaxID=53468 RepID=A0A0R3UC69_MESCO|nr:unnamed protein product [Mesocestoides corti]